MARYGGRAKGTPNKVTGAVRDMVVQALTEEGGVNYLRDQARENPRAFLALVARCIPAHINLRAEFGPEMIERLISARKRSQLPAKEQVIEVEEEVEPGEVRH